MSRNESAQEGIRELEPKAVWRFFAGIAGVPRPSKNEEMIRAHIKKVAGEAGLTARQDATGNIVISAPASPGRESAPITVLQGHLDMVPEKNTGTQHDFDRDPIRLVLDKEDSEQIVRAEGTTLGADNGIGVAMGLAAATLPDVKHGPLELLFTTDEEAGMTGAKALTTDFVKGRRMLNLDSEEDDVIYIGCAGGTDSTLVWELDATPAAGGAEICSVKVSGLRGGHSGSDIHKNYASANRVLLRTLLRVDPAAQLRVGSLAGGSKRNAIAREASAVVTGSGSLMEALIPAAEAMTEAVRDESGEQNPSIVVEPVAPGMAAAFLSPDNSQRLLRAAMALPHGVMGMHSRVPTLVETSNNVGILTTDMTNKAKARLRFTIMALTRSSCDSRMAEALRQIAAVAALAGAQIVQGNEYPGWSPNLDSKLLATGRQVYEKLFGGQPRVEAIHAGLECGIIGKRLGRMDTISIGPRIEGAHSPDERVYVASVQKSWKYLTALLDELSS